MNPIDRRTFLVLTGAPIVVACVPDAPEPAAWRNRSTPERDAGTETAARDGGPKPVADAPDAGFVDAGTPTDAGTDPRDGGTPPPRDGGDCGVVQMHDTYAQALYFDGTHGPLTGVIEVAFVVAGDPVEIEFWHGHGGQNHRYRLGPEEFEALKRGERVTIETTEVDGHSHLLFVDPRDEDYRVPGAPSVDVAVC